jgi:hypothetical protein
MCSYSSCNSHWQFIMRSTHLRMLSLIKELIVKVGKYRSLPSLLLAAAGGYGHSILSVRPMQRRPASSKVE